MKLVKILVKLSAIAAVCAGFCGSGNVVKAVPKNRISSRGFKEIKTQAKNAAVCARSKKSKLKPKGIRSKNGRFKKYKFLKLDKRQQQWLSKSEQFYYKNGLNKCENNKFFHLGVHVDPQGSDFNIMYFRFSPTMLKKLCSSAAYDFRNVTSEIIDENGCKYSFVEYLDFSNGFASDRTGKIGFDCYVRGLLNMHTVKTFPQAADADRCHVDDGFEILAGRNYRVRLLNAEGEVIVEEECVAEGCGHCSVHLDSEHITKKIAHPAEFDGNYYIEFLKDKTTSLAKSVAQLT